MNQLRLLMLVFCASLLVGGCTSDTQKATDLKPISTLPQNRPERWEGQGMMGGMLNTR